MSSSVRMRLWVVYVLSIQLIIPAVPGAPGSNSARISIEFACDNLDDCDTVLVYGSAFACSPSTHVCECHPNSTLIGRSCECNEGFKREGRGCIKLPGSPCSSNSDCNSLENGVCLSGNCSCNTGTINYDNQCLKVADKFGEKCVTVKQCTPNLGSDVECLNSQCSCKEGDYVVVTIQDKQRCLKTQRLNEDCQVSAQCVLTDNSECMDGKCVCKTGFSDAQNIKCLPNRKLGEKCEEQAQCYNMSGPLAGCRNNACVCENFAYHNGSLCLNKKGLKESCKDSYDGCYTEVGGAKYIECSNAVCSCKSGTKESTKGAYCESGVGQALVSIGLLLAALVSCSSI